MTFESVLTTALGFGLGILMYRALRKLWKAMRRIRIATIKAWWAKKATRKRNGKRLEQMACALQVTLTERQRETILAAEMPDLRGWARKSGKTLCAVLWLLIHFENYSMSKMDFCAKYCDPDVGIFGLSYRWGWNNAQKIIAELEAAGVKITLRLEEGQGYE